MRNYEDIFSKCDQVSHLLKKPLMENIFCAVWDICANKYTKF